MTIIYETKNFIVESFDQDHPHVDRNEGWHIRILPKKKVKDRTYLSPSLAIECERLTRIVGKALVKGMKKNGVDIIRVNYYDMWNRAYKTGKKPFFHIHVYGRTLNAKYQPFPEAIQLPDRSTWFYNNFKPLTDKDNQSIRKEIEKLFTLNENKDKNRKLK